MSKKKPLFVTFEGIEGSGKSYQSKKLFNRIKSEDISTIYTREPGGCYGSEIIRKIILNGPKNKFYSSTDTLLYLAARNEHVNKVLSPAILKKKNIICDRFIDSTLAYQVYGKGIKKSLVDNVHSYILDGIKPDLTFILTVNIKKAFKRLKKRKYKNRYDNFTKNFYNKVQKGFIDLSKKNKKRYFVLDNSEDSKKVEMIIYRKFIEYQNR